MTILVIIESNITTMLSFGVWSVPPNGGMLLSMMTRMVIALHAHLIHHLTVMMIHMRINLLQGKLMAGLDWHMFRIIGDVPS
jgi:hypothetical protein